MSETDEIETIRRALRHAEQKGKLRVVAEVVGIDVQTLSGIASGDRAPDLTQRIVLKNYLNR